MTHDIGVNVLAQMEPDREPARVRVRVVIRNEGHPGGVGKSRADGRRFARDMRRARQPGRVGRRSKRACEQNPFCMRGPEARMQSEDGVELLKHLFA